MNLESFLPMSPAILFVCGLALSSALLSGLFFVFSNFAMKAFDGLPAPNAIQVMQAINDRILNSGFLGIFMGTGSGSLLALAVAIWHWDRPGSLWVFGGALVLLVGTYGVTFFINVPLNHWLDSVQATDDKPDEAWHKYLSRWHPWNHVRTVTSFVAAILMTIGAMQMLGG